MGDVVLWLSAEPSSAALLSRREVVDFLLPEVANDEEFTQFRKDGLKSIQENIGTLQSFIIRLPKQHRGSVAAPWQKIVEEVHHYLQLYLRIIEAFLEVQKEVRTFVHHHLFIEVMLGLPPLTWLPTENKPGNSQRHRPMAG